MCLTVVAGPGAGQRRRLENEPITIGRASACDVVLPDLCVSRHHARIVCRDGTWCAEDLGSRHGTFVSGRRIGESRRLSAGDEILIASSHIRVDANAGDLDTRDTQDVAACHPVLERASTGPTQVPSARLERLERDLGLARQVQRALLLPPPPRVRGLDIAVAYESAFEVGGDFYDFAVLPDGRLAVAVGDVAGKAVSAALYMARLTSELRHQTQATARPAHVVANVNAAMLALGDGGGMFSTLVCAVLDARGRRLVYTNAGHVPPVLCRRGQARALRTSRAHCVPVGIVPGRAPGEAAERLWPGDVIVFATDGIVEARGADGEYGSGRLLKIVASAAPGQRARGVVDAILADVRRHTATTAQADDITAVAIRVTG